MPVRKISYTCEFRCGQKAAPLRKMEQHEDKCWKNPKNKSCFTCNNGHLDTIKPDEDYCPELGYNVITCKFNEVNLFLESDEYEFLKSHKTANYKLIEPIVNCPFYNSGEFDNVKFKLEVVNPHRSKCIKEIRERESDELFSCGLPIGLPM